MGSFVKGTIFLMAVIFISKLLGFVYRMQFMRIAGEEVVGMYMTAYPTFIFFIAIAQLGIPIAVAKLTAEFEAKGQPERVQATLKVSMKLSLIAVIVMTPIIAFSVPFIANTLLHNEALLFTLYISLCTVPFVVFAGLLKAYLQGLAKIAPTAWAQLLEQLVRIALIMALLPVIIQPDNAALSAAYAMGITAIGEVFSLLFLYVYYLRMKKSSTKVIAGKTLVKPIFRLALPSAGSRLFGTFTWFLEPIVFLKALTVSGITAASATTLYGVISGVHIPLLLFPAFIPSALAIVLIPAVSDAMARKNLSLLNNRIEISLRLSSLIGCIAATIFFLHGDELTMRLFHLDENRGYMQILAPIFYFYYIQSPLHSILQAVDEARVAMLNSIYGGVGKLFIMFVLASQPFLQESGAIIAIGFGVLITSFLHIASIRQHKQIAIGFRIFLVPYLIFIFICVLQPYVTNEMPLVESMAITTFLISALFILTKQIRMEDFRLLRSIFSRL